MSSPFKFVVLAMTFGIAVACGSQPQAATVARDGSTRRVKENLPQTASQSPDSNDPNIALLVGCNLYPQSQDYRRLYGSENDVMMMKKLLIEVFGFKESNIRTLVNEQATSANIEKHFQDFLIERAQKDGQTVFYFSGHGGRLQDDGHDEQDKCDEALITHDHRDNDESGSIRDEVLGLWLADLTAKSDNVTVILDCCHSGSGARGDDTPNTMIARTARSPIRSAECTEEEDINKGLSGFLPPNPNYVLLSAARDRQFAFEYHGSGLFTRSLNRVIRHTFKRRSDMTYRELIQKVSAQVSSRQPRQEPQLEGPRRDAKVFGELGKVQPYLEVERVDLNQGKVILSGGDVHSVTPGSVYDVYPMNVTNTDDETLRLGQVTVETVGPFRSWARIDSGLSDPVAGGNAFEVKHNYGDLQLPIFVDLEGYPELKAQIDTILTVYGEKEDLVKHVPADIAEFLLTASHSGDTLKILRADLSVVKSLAIAEDDFGLDLMQALTKIARWHNLYRLRNRDSQIEFGIVVKRFAYDPVMKKVGGELPFETTEDGSKLLMGEGDVFTIELSNKSAKGPVYFYLLDLGTDGSIELLFPPEGAEDSPVPPKGSISSGYLQTGPPPGLEVIKVIATTEATNFSALSQAGYRGMRGEGPADEKRGLDSPLGRLLNMAYGGTRSKPLPTKISDWATADFAFYLRQR